jgi:cob(I)alamin adenosyltransferase
VRIYTKTGDEGDTGLFGGERVPKDHRRVAAYGDVDELNATIGFALALEPEDFERSLFHTVQRDLFTIGAELATPDVSKLRRSLPGPEIGDAAVAALEAAIDAREATLPPLKNYILPGGTAKAAALHGAHGLPARRAQRGGAVPRRARLSRHREVPQPALRSPVRVGPRRERTGRPHRSPVVTIRVPLVERRDASYDIRIGRGLLGELPALLAAQPAARCAVISDSHVGKLYGERVVAELQGADVRAELITFPAGEWNKTRETWSALSDPVARRALRP